MTIAVVLGCVMAVLLNLSVTRQIKAANKQGGEKLLPIVGAVLRRDWVALAVDISTISSTVALWHIHGWSMRFVLVWAAAALLIHTAAIDWRVRLIDTLLMLGATAAALVFAPLLAGNWLNALLGTLAAALVFVLLFVVARLLYPQQHAPFGLGDVYLGMFIGALVGLTDVGAALLGGIILAGLASVVLLVAYGYKRARHMPIAYGTFLCIGVLLHLVIR